MKQRYHTHEQLFALCVLLNWPAGLAVGGHQQDGTPFVVLRGSDHSNEGNGITKLYTETNAENCVQRMAQMYGDPSTLQFTVLGYPLEARFDQDGVGAVTYRA